MVLYRKWMDGKLSGEEVLSYIRRPPRNNAAKHNVSVCVWGCVGVLAGVLIKVQMLL